MRATKIVLVVVGIELFLSVGACLGQGLPVAMVVGTVRDQSGLPIPGASVQVRRLSTNQLFSATTTDAGDYIITDLTPDTYDLTASKSGFKVFVQPGMVLETGQTYRVDVQLSIGTATQTVQVTGQAPILQTESPENAQTVDEQQVTNLPNGGGDWFHYFDLVAGEMPIRGTVDGSESGVNFEGQRWTDNIVTIDGTEVQSGNGSGTFTPNLDALESVHIESGLYGAEYGIRPGGQIITATRSGTNTLHGDLFDFLENNHLDARNFFQPGPNSQYKRNIFGATVGGPIDLPKVFNGKDKAWFFFSYQGNRTRSLDLYTGTVPTAAQEEGIFNSSVTNPVTGLPFATNASGQYVIPSTSISPISSKFLPFWPAPNTAGANNFTSPNTSAPYNGNQVMTRVDVSTSQKSRWYGRFIYDSSPALDLDAISQFSTIDPLRTYSQTLNNTRIFSPTMVNDFAASWYRRPYYPGSHPSSNSGASFGIPGFPTRPIDLTGVPLVNISGYLELGDFHEQGPVNVTNWSAKDTLRITKGAHSLEAGFQWLKLANNWDLGSRTIFTFDPHFTGNAFASFLLGDPINEATGGVLLRLNDRENNLYPFIEDHWRATRKLTLDLGLRYEHKGAWYDKRGFSSNFNPATGTLDPPLQNLTLQPWQTGRFLANVPVISPTPTSVLPRLGFAYLLTSKTVVRGGFGIYANEPVIGYLQAAGENPRTNDVNETFQSSLTTPTLGYASPFSGAAGSIGTPTEYGMQNPLLSALTYEFGLAVERQLTSEMSFRVSYVGSNSVHQFDPTELNDATPGSAPLQSRRPYPQLLTVYYAESHGQNNVNGLEVSLQRRPGKKGVSFLASYGWIRSIDDYGDRLSTADAPTYVSPNITDKANRGASTGDIPGRFVLSGGYDLPFGPGKALVTSGPGAQILRGWSLTGIYSYIAGPWDSVAFSYDYVGVGGTASQWPNQIEDPNLPSSQRTTAEWFNTTAFVNPPQYTYGDAGRSTIKGPGITNLDFSVLRTFNIHEAIKMQFRVEAYNAFNNVTFGQPNISYSTTAFGTIGSANASRTVQFGLKLFF